MSSVVSTKLGNGERDKLIEECNKRGVTVSDFVKQAILEKLHSKPTGNVETPNSAVTQDLEQMKQMMDDRFEELMEVVNSKINQSSEDILQKLDKEIGSLIQTLSQSYASKKDVERIKRKIGFCEFHDG